jgi:ATP-dependent helicase/nuclease subunit A
VLILVRARGALFEGVIRALKDARVEVAGADRLVLNEHIAVMDLLSLADALLLPEDDLALAEVLKSPLFGLSEEQLFDLAYGRAGSLRKALRTKSATNPAFAEAAVQLDRLAEDALTQLPFTFYANVLGPAHGRKRMLERLGHEANDALDEFLALALDYERRETPSLQGFVAWMRAGRVEVKRDMDIVRDEVRVMTVHGAKGLEAPIVILADTIGKPEGPRQPNLLMLEPQGLPAGAPSAVIWAGKKGDDVDAVATARDKARGLAEDEHRRLLYVAMTRAADRLIVCGACGVNVTPKGCWYNLVFDALTPEAEKIDTANGEGAVWVWTRSDSDAASPVTESPSAESLVAVEEASWLHCSPPAAEVAATPVAPSLAVAKRAAGSAAHIMQRDGDGYARGRLVHRLLQSLPALAPGARRDAAHRYLAGAASLPADAAEALIQEVIAVLDHPDFAALFSPGTRAEIPIVGMLPTTMGKTFPISGQIDRLAVAAEQVLIADFKSDRVPPRAAPDNYVTQLALYRAVIRNVYPGRVIRAALVWTQAPRLDEVPAERLDSALASLAIRAP